MNIVAVMSQNASRANRRLPIGRSLGAAGRNAASKCVSRRRRGTLAFSPRFSAAILSDGEAFVNDDTRKQAPPPPVISAPPERDIERKVKQHPDDLSARVDLGSDESMDASDPISVAQPGSNEPVPSSDAPD